MHIPIYMYRAFTCTYAMHLDNTTARARVPCASATAFTHHMPKAQPVEAARDPRLINGRPSINQRHPHARAALQWRLKSQPLHLHARALWLPPEEDVHAYACKCMHVHCACLPRRSAQRMKRDACMCMYACACT
mmetsp:Transcript_76639/g.151914  ORF Transcript_76639/g.151914 Transcript_76639/m.151914 type:complete len:134 (-) Transcript_76639:1451-1852(-)